MLASPPPCSSPPPPVPQVSVLNKYSEAIRGSLTKIMRLKIVALVTIEVHARDVLEKLYKASLMDVSSFDWLSQLRFYWDKVPGPRCYPRPPGAPVPRPGFALGPVPSPEAGQLTTRAADRAQEGRGHLCGLDTPFRVGCRPFPLWSGQNPGLVTAASQSPPNPQPPKLLLQARVSLPLPCCSRIWTTA